MSEFKLNEGQQRAYDMIANTTNNIVVGGQAGTGKSVLIQRLKEDFGHNTLFLSTTGISAINIGGMTMHSGLSLPIGHVTKEALKKVSPKSTKLFSSGSIKRIVIDEYSMITPSMWYGLTERLKRFSKKTKKRDKISFQIILLGDICQIPAVLLPVDIKLAKEDYNTTKFYLMDEFKSMDFRLVELTEIMRQTDNVFKSMLNHIRTAVPVDRVNNKPVYSCEVNAAIDYFNKRVIYPLPKDVPVLCSTNKSVDAYNKIAFDRNYNPTGVFKASFTGDFKPKELPCNPETRLKVGLGVIILKNSPHDSMVVYSNGDAGIVTNMSADGVTVKLARTGEEVLIEPSRYEKHGYETKTNEDGEEELSQYVSGSATCVSILQNSGISIHRSQGSTMNSAIVDLGWSCTFTTALVYVALSRLRSIEGLYLKRKIRPEDISVDLDALNWIEELRQKSK